MRLLLEAAVVDVVVVSLRDTAVNAPRLRLFYADGRREMQPGL
jgi:hypothetical protein